MGEGVGNCPRFSMVKIDRDITIVREGITYRFQAGDVVNPDKWPGLRKHLKPAYSDKMQRSKVDK